MASPAEKIAKQVGAVDPPPNDDPAFASPTDPLGPEDNAPANQAGLRARAGLVRRDIPIILSATALTIGDVRAAVADLVVGLFDAPAQVVDVLTGDSRVAAGLASRIGGLLGREVAFEIPRAQRDSSAARECRDAFAERWPIMAPESVLAEMQLWAIMLYSGIAQMPWDMSGEYATPIPRVWHPRYTWFHWNARRLIANTLDGVAVIEPGDGKWIQHAPHGVYRGWMRGAIRPIAPWMIARNLALRDSARWSEANGMPLMLFKHPASADRLEVERARYALSNRGGETCVDLPQNVPEGGGSGANFDLAYLEAKGENFEGFFKLIDACDREITLALMAQTLTTSMPEGGASYAAARVHADVKQALLEADARALERTVYTQIARPFALANFGDANLAPRVVWDITPYEDAKTKVDTFAVLTQGLNVLRQAGVQVEDIGALARSFGLNLGKLRNLTEGAEIYQYDLQYGIVTTNEARERKGLPPRAGGDQRPQPVGEPSGAPARVDAGTHARIAALVEENRRLRVAAGQDPNGELAAEVEALAALTDLPSRTNRRRVTR